MTISEATLEELPKFSVTGSGLSRLHEPYPFGNTYPIR